MAPLPHFLFAMTTKKKKKKKTMMMMREITAAFAVGSLWWGFYSLELIASSQGPDEAGLLLCPLYSCNDAK